MNILVMGGSYFYGRVFTIMASKEHQLTLFNRGTYSMDAFKVQHIKGDRHDKEALKQLQGVSYDAVVDFSGYTAEDVLSVLDVVDTKQYIFISTVDVYQRGLKTVHKEDTPYEERDLGAEVGEYIKGKVQAEKAIIAACSVKGIPYTILRPATMYGPFNYAPREATFVQRFFQEQILPLIDCEGIFQFVYVKDAAEAVIKCLGNPVAYNKAYNIAGNEIMNYPLFIGCLKECIENDDDWKGAQLMETLYTVEEAKEADIILPFPITLDESELNDNALSREELGMEYTPFLAGMEKTYKSLKKVFLKDDDKKKQNGGMMGNMMGNMGNMMGNMMMR